MSSTRRDRLALLAAALAGLLLAANLATAQGQNKIVYDSFEWEVYASTHFQVFYYAREKETLQKVVSMAESSYDELSRRLNYQVPKPIPLIYYATHAEFEQNNIILNFIPEGVGAFAEPARNRMVLPIDLPDDKLQALIQHELTHIFQYEILFGGRLGRALTSSAPTWFMEGMASYFGADEDDKDRMFLRDAVNSDSIPPITRVQIEGYTAYRYGHAVFDFIEAEWGREAVREFIYEYRSFQGRDVATAIRRSFEIEPDDFDLKFRRYLRRKYLPLLAVKGEASEYGDRFRVGRGERGSYEISAAAAPSGDFVAAVTTHKDDVDIALFSTKTRRLYKNLTAGKTTKYEYLSAQFLTAAPESGRDLSFAPDGDRIAVFARRERGRQLFIFSARSGEILERIPVGPDMPMSPAFSADGRQVLFSGIVKSSRDIFSLDLKTKEIRNLSNDEAFDIGPVSSPDGRWVYHSKIVAGLSKVVQPVEDPTKVEQVTWGEGNDEDPALSPDGKRLYFASSRGGIFNIYGQELENGDLVQYTDVIGAAIGPVSFLGPDGQEKIVFSGFQAQRFQLYMADARKPFRKLEEKALPPTPITTGAVAGFVPALEVAIDPDKVTKPKFKLFVDNAGVQAGVSSDGTFISTISVSLSDYLGDHRGMFIFDSIAGYSNFRLGYFNVGKRFQYGAQIYDQRQYFIGVSNVGTVVTGERISKQTGVSLEGIYPLSRYFRLQGNVGYMSRTLDVPYYVTNADGTQVQYFSPRSDDVPTGGVGFSYDTVQYQSFGGHSGAMVSGNFQYTPSFEGGEGSLSEDLFGEGRLYLPVSRRVLFAFRAFGARSRGAAPNVYYFGGLDTLRGYDYRTLIGNNVFYLNSEFRFPLIDILSVPFLPLFQGVRGRVFLDLGGAYLNDQPFKCWNGDANRLQDCVSSYGVGLTVWFLGLPWNIDFSRPWDFHSSLTGSQTTFYVGYSF